MRRALLAATILAAGALAVWWLIPGGEGPATPVAEAPVVPAPPPPPPPIGMVEVGGGAGTVLPVAAPDSRTLSDDGVKAVTAFAESTGTQALLVWHLGALQVEYYGPGTRPFDRLDGQGLGQGLMVLLAGHALQDGTLTDIERPLSTWLPEWAADPRGRITVRQLLEGTSGLDMPPGPPGTDAAAWTLSAPLAAEPGTRFQPSAIETQLLGLALTRAAGKPLARYMAEAFWQPLGARAAEIQADAQGVPQLTCCVRATARDWLRLGLLVLDGGTVDNAALVPTRWLDEMLRPTLFSRNEGWRMRFAWPFDRNGPVKAKEPFTEGDMAFLAGEGGQRLYVSKGRELVILRLGAPVADWDESRLPNLVAKSLAPPPPAKRALISRQAGAELPPITKPPPVPTVETVPLAPADERTGETGIVPAPDGGNR